MADSDNPYQPFFLTHLPTVIPEEKDRQILLDGLAREYADLEGWMAYVDRERQSTTCRNAGSDPTKRPS
jgi:hypothetical protein